MAEAGFWYEGYHRAQLLYIRWGLERNGDLSLEMGVGLAKYPALGITYLLQIQKWVCHVCALFRVFVLMHEHLNPADCCAMVGHSHQLLSCCFCIAIVLFTKCVTW